MGSALFSCDPDPEHAGWHRWLLTDPTVYNEAVLGRVRVRVEGEKACRVRIIPRQMLTNMAGNVHGGATLGLCDVSLFAALYMLRGVDPSLATTVDLSAQFIGAGDAGRPLDAVVELLRETRRLCFLRGLIVQDDDLVASFSGTIRKPTTAQ